MSNKVRVGMVGLGGISYAHQPGYEAKPDRAVIAAVCDIDEAKARKRAAKHGAKVYTDYRDLVSDPEVDLVDVTLPHDLHYPVAMAALEQGKHLLLEKPLAMTTKEALEILEKAQAGGQKFTVAENTRFVIAYTEAEMLLKRKALGGITLVRTFLPGSERMRLSSPGWWGKRRAQGGGAIIDSAPHTFYLIKWLFGEFHDVRAFTSQILALESEVEDNAVVMGHLANGAEYHCGFSFSTEIPWNERLEVYGTKGSLVIDQLCNPPAVHFDGGGDFKGHPLEAVPYQPAGWKYFSIVEEVKDFVDAVYDDRTPLVDPRDAYYAIRVIEKAYESSVANDAVNMED